MDLLITGPKYGYDLLSKPMSLVNDSLLGLD